jgi:hypothetical protein
MPAAACASSPDGQWLAVAPATGPLLLWDSVASNLECALQSPSAAPHAHLVFLPNSHMIAVCAADGSVALVDVVTAVTRARLLLPTAPQPHGVSFDARGARMIALCGEGQLALYDIGAVRRAAEGDGPPAELQRIPPPQLSRQDFAGALPSQPQSAWLRAQTGMPHRAEQEVRAPPQFVPARSIRAFDAVTVVVGLS